MRPARIDLPGRDARTTAYEAAALRASSWCGKPISTNPVARSTRAGTDVVVDSIHTIPVIGRIRTPGSDYQVKVCGQGLDEVRQGTPASWSMIVAHVNKDGDISGPMNFEHAGDATLMLWHLPRSG